MTGSNKGMGYALVEALAARGGWRLIMAVRNVQLGDASKNSISERHPQATVSLEKLDISDSKSIDEFVAVVREKYKEVDVLVNNAGIAWGENQVDEDTLKATFSTVRLNPLRTSGAPWNCLRNCYPCSRRRARL